MAITYDPTNETVIIDNGEYTPENIYQASQSNGWNICFKCGNGSGYFLDANLQVGQSHETYFSVENCYFQVGSEIAYKFIKLPNYYGKGFSVKNSHFKWYVDSASNWWYGRWTIENSKVEKYSSGIFPRMAAGFTAVDSIILGRSIDVEYGTVELRNTRFDLAGTRFQLGNLSGLGIDNVVFYNGSDILFMASGSTLINSKIQDVARAFYLAGDGVWAQVIDCEFEEKYKFDYDSNYLLIKYSFACTVYDEDGNPIKNAEVRLYDVNDNLVFDESTDENGQTISLPILYKKVEGTSYIETLYSPHKLIVIKDGYPTFEGKFNIDKTLNKIVILGHTLSYTLDDIYAELQIHRSTVEPNIDTTISSRLASDDSRLDNLDTTISSRSSHTPADVWNYATRELTNPDDYKANVNNLATEDTVQAIKAKTDNLPDDPASNTNIDAAKTDITNLINELLDVEEGNWEINNNQMIFYKRDGTELMRFNLYDKNGNLSEVNVHKRERT